MRTYADPTTCPSCGAPATAAPRCGTCAVDLRGADAREVLRLLATVDGLLGTMRADAASWRSRVAAAPAPGQFVPTRAYPATPAPPARSPWSVGALLLALGALCLVVAAFVFVSVAWGSLGLGGRTAVLVAVTGVVGGAAALATARRLRGSAEALAAVTAGLVALDYWAARGYGLAGLGALDGAPATVVFGLLLLAVGVAATLASRGRLGSTLVVGELTALLGAASVTAGLAALSDGSFWGGFVGVLAAGGVWACARVAGLRVLRVGSVVVALTSYVLLTAAQLVLLGLGPVLGSPTDLADAALRTLALTAVAAGVAAGAVLVLPGRAGVASAAVVVAVGQVVLPLLVVAGLDPRVGDHVLTSSAVVAAAVVALALLGWADLGAVGRGLRASAVLWSLPVVGLLAGWLVLAVTAAVTTVLPVWSGRATDPVAVDASAPLGPWWSSLLLAASLSVAAAVASLWRRSPAPAGARRALPRVAVGVAAAAALLQPLIVPAPAWVPVAVAGGVALAGLAVSCWRGSAAVEAAVVGALAVASGLAAVDQALSLVTWALASMVLGVVAARSRDRRVVAASSGSCALAVLAVVATASDLLAAPDRVVQLATAVAVLLVVGSAQMLARVLSTARRDALRLPVEVVAAVVAVPVLLAVPGETLAWRALVWTVLGAGAAFVGLLVADRRLVGVAGSALLAGAYVMRLLASDVGLVEAYTLPFAVLLGIAGVVVLRRRPTTGTWLALGPALALGLLPSLPLVLADPTSLRGLLLGLGSLAVLGTGIVLRWQAPVVAGASVAAVLVLRHLGPYADAVPRWVLIAVAGLTLLAVGITWESRVRQARSAALVLRTLR
ncbi:SCO7613 C-terminal domain-containing membrane protein [Solicola sp. PLA-1-18]|uniref:SCO7613 C-terminal domain-containing membrane protein n=1 Tax=Solicola sp. PLA-1-18 TaxID=3380532 RepID=UPI003B7BB92A